MKLHWTQELKNENARLKAALEYLKSQMRLIPHSRFEKYRNAKDTESTMAYRKCAQEVDRLSLAALHNVQDIIEGE
jgi:hypothetical protein